MKIKKNSKKVIYRFYIFFLINIFSQENIYLMNNDFMKDFILDDFLLDSGDIENGNVITENFLNLVNFWNSKSFFKNESMEYSIDICLLKKVCSKIEKKTTYLVNFFMTKRRNTFSFTSKNINKAYNSKNTNKNLNTISLNETDKKQAELDIAKKQAEKLFIFIEHLEKGLQSLKNYKNKEILNIFLFRLSSNKGSLITLKNNIVRFF